jgi:AraC-like DNA-binding protein
MDVHIIPGVKAKDVAEAHRLDLAAQDEHGCRCMTYWIDEERENVFCLVEAPTQEAVEQLHRNTHGLVPNKIIEVNKAVVESFLGRIYDPEVAGDGLKVFEDPAYRVLLVTQNDDPVVLQNQYGEEKISESLDVQNQIIRKQLAVHDGREAEFAGSGFVISFRSAKKALDCAMAVMKAIHEAGADLLNTRMAINGGEPVENDKELFGDVRRFATQLCMLPQNSGLAIASSVKQLLAKDHLSLDKNSIVSLSQGDEELIKQLFTQLEANWQDPDFDAENFCSGMAMSKSQFYRKTVSITGLSPNILLKEFRLEKAKDLMMKKRYSISQITFESGFSSPSYFTKCFKKKYNLLPLAYIDQLH